MGGELTDDIRPSPSLDPIFSVQSIVCPSLDIARAYAANLTSDEEKCSTTIQLSPFVSTAEIPLYSRKEKSTKSTDKEMESIELMYTADFVLNMGENSPQKIRSWDEVVDRESSHSVATRKFALL